MITTPTETQIADTRSKITGEVMAAIVGTWKLAMKKTTYSTAVAMKIAFACVDSAATVGTELSAGVLIILRRRITKVTKRMK